jgi:hypothetical protein
MSRNESFQGNKFRHETKVVGQTCAADIDAATEPRYRERRREPHDKLRGSSEILDPILNIPQMAAAVRRRGAGGQTDQENVC